MNLYTKQKQTHTNIDNELWLQGESDKLGVSGINT